MISIVLPVWNGEKFLGQALESVRCQTDRSLEVIVVDDCSSDKTPVILHEFSKKWSRIKVLRNKKRLGVGASLNRAIRNSLGNYIARADADDIMDKDRLKIERRFLEKNSHVVAVGSWMKVVDSSGGEIGERRMPIDDVSIREMMFYAMGMQNPTVMFNRKLIPKNFSWCKEEGFVDDLDLLFRLMEFGEFANVPKFLVRYRIHQNNLSLRRPKATFWEAQQIRENAVRNLKYRPTLKARVLNEVEKVIVNALPERSILHAYNFFRKLQS